MKRLSAVSVLGLCTAMAGWSTPTSAATPADQAAAQALFDDGLKLLNGAKYSDACPKLEESDKLDPAVATKYQLARCYEAVGKTASAWALYVAVADAAKRAANVKAEQTARRRAQALDGKLTKLSIKVAASAKPIEAIVIKRDGVEIGRAMVDVAIPVDPGPHEVAASAPGYETWRQLVSVAPGPRTEEVTIPPLVPSPVAAPAPPLAAAPAPPLPAAAPPSAAVPAVAAPKPDAYTPGAVRVSFEVPSGDYWSLRDSDGKQLCQLPCARWVGENSGMYLSRDNGSNVVRLPGMLPVRDGQEAVATLLPARGSPAWAAVVTILAASFSAFGAVGAVRGSCQDASSNFHYGSDCLNTGYKDTTTLDASMSVFFGVGALAAGYWWFWSRSTDQLEVKARHSAALPRPAEVAVGPFGVRVRF
jgi:hypothetical protein